MREGESAAARSCLKVGIVLTVVSLSFLGCVRSDSTSNPESGLGGDARLRLPFVLGGTGGVG